MSPQVPGTTPMGALYALVLALFSAEEFRRELGLGPYADIVPELPGEVTADAHVIDKALAVLQRRGLINSAFFAWLERERPGRRVMILAVAALWRRPEGAATMPPLDLARARRVRVRALTGSGILIGVLLTLPPVWQRPREAAVVESSLGVSQGIIEPPPPPDMVRIEAGEFVMGSTAEEVSAAQAECRVTPAQVDCDTYFQRETPTRQVKVTTFDLDRAEVSVEAFAHWLDTHEDFTAKDGFVTSRGKKLFRLGHERYSGIRRQADGFVANEDAVGRPVTMVTWRGADLYCRAYGKRLPSESEWEFAARGPKRRRYPSTDAALECPSAVFGRDPGNLPIRVKTLPGPCAHLPAGPAVEGTDHTPEGVSGLGGNVREWVEDIWPAAPAERAIRGCGWNEPAVLCRGARRSHDDPEYADVAVGFRCARSIEVADKYNLGHLTEKK